MELILQGQIVRLTDRRAFKIGIVIGPSLTRGKARVCPWQNASRTWSPPQVMDTKWLERIFPAAWGTREQGVIRRAQKSVTARSEVAWAGGSVTIGQATP